MTTALTTQDHASLTACEAVITKGRNTFVEVGEALETIRDGRLYRLTHSTFAEYCEDKWGFGARHANDTISSSRVVKSLKEENGKHASQTDLGDSQSKACGEQIAKMTARTASALARIDPKKRLKTLAKCAKRGNVTAKAIDVEAERIAPRNNFAPAERRSDHSVYTTGPVSGGMVETVKELSWQLAVHELVHRRHKAWAEKFGSFPKTIIDEIVKTVKEAL